MNNYEVGDNFIIHSYKHNGRIHREWDEAIYLGKFNDAYVFGNNKTLVTESDGKTWKTKEPAIMYFYPDRWFNIIGQLKNDGIYYYCNIATPFIMEGNTLKYIDYDLDLRIFPNHAFKVLDRNEYNYHKKIMGYSTKLDQVVKGELSNLIELARLRKWPFDEEEINKFYKSFQEIKKSKKRTNIKEA